MNISEIAKLSGVSRATVSRYLNDGYVSEEKREQIKKVIEKTGYNPSTQAQMLRTKKTKLIGVIIPKINSESVSRMVAGISKAISEKGYQMLLANTENHEREELKYLNIFKNNQVDGIVLMATILTKEHKKILKEMKIPVVILGQKLAGYSCVYYDDYHAAKELTEYLLKHGKKPGYLGVTIQDEAAGKSRQEGFLDAVKEAGNQLNPVMLETDFTMESAYHKAGKLFETEKEIDTIFCATDNIAAGVMKYLNETGRKVPEDVQIAGIGDSAVGKVLWPGLTTVHYFYKTSGMEAANMLLDMIASNEYVKKELKMGYKVIIHNSTRN